MTNLEYTLGINEIDEKSLNHARELLRLNARAVLENKFVMALLEIVRHRARGAMTQALQSNDEQQARDARNKLVGYQSIFSEIALLQAAVTNKESDNDE